MSPHVKYKEISFTNLIHDPKVTSMYVLADAVPIKISLLLNKITAVCRNNSNKWI